MEPSSVAQLDARPIGDQEVTGSTPTEVGNILSWKLIMKYLQTKYANSAYPDQTAPEGKSLFRVNTVCFFTKYFKKQQLLDKKQNLGQSSME